MVFIILASSASTVIRGHGLSSGWNVSFGMTLLPISRSLARCPTGRLSMSWRMIVKTWKSLEAFFVHLLALVLMQVPKRTMLSSIFSCGRETARDFLVILHVENPHDLERFSPKGLQSHVNLRLNPSDCELACLWICCLAAQRRRFLWCRCSCQTMSAPAEGWSSLGARQASGATWTNEPSEPKFLSQNGLFFVVQLTLSVGLTPSF